ncbi:D-amino acid aminotransferase [Variovorax sp. NFACC27]|uniref:D-amino acid aminotransferase n=1 Tax=unclassified Variovorax TaxID=663243 RepID=UPI00089B1B46|nr:D-alanine transaminase [Variovorax sp. NFACC28]SEG95539.1 D-alanine transaminase [Variovorax sp. NFACC29]SFD77897.1 D-alanine transaminase [Variovorax sp. NFACC26]SFG92285.1 D-alanine transaminase [Variovorax sp. NFACC27]
MHPITDALPATLCYLDGEYTALRDAKISVLDRGFIFGDGIYEYVPVYFGQPFCFEEHMARLDRSLAELQIENPLSLEQWREIVMRLVAPGGDEPQSVYFQVTRGVAPRDHAMVRGIRPTVFVMVNPLPPSSEAVRAKGVACVTAADFRWQKAHIKSTSLLGAVLARQISVEAGAAETIMFRDDWLSEASSSNVWIVKDGKLMGPPKNNLVLTGIRYGLFERLSKTLGIPFALRPISREEVFAADEVLISSASKELLPVVTLDGKLIGNGRPGPIYKSLYEAYQEAKVHNAQTQKQQKHGVPA